MLRCDMARKITRNEVRSGAKSAECGLAPEIEITVEMIEAGYRVLAASGITDDLLEADRLIVAEIYASMRLAECRPGEVTHLL